MLTTYRPGSGTQQACCRSGPYQLFPARKDRRWDRCLAVACPNLFFHIQDTALLSICYVISDSECCGSPSNSRAYIVCQCSLQMVRCEKKNAYLGVRRSRTSVSSGYIDCPTLITCKIIGMEHHRRAVLMPLPLASTGVHTDSLDSWKITRARIICLFSCCILMLLEYVALKGPCVLWLDHARHLSLFPSPLQFPPLCFTTIRDGYEPLPTGNGSQILSISKGALPTLQLGVYALYGWT